MKTTTFNQFLNESSSQKEISVDEAYKIIKQKCKNANLEKPILYQSTNPSTNDVLLVKGNFNNWQPHPSENYTCMLMDKFFSKTPNYPLRKKSFICTTYDDSFENKNTKNVYAVFPFDTTYIAQLYESDLSYVEYEVNYSEKSVKYWDELFNDVDLDSTSFSKFVSGIKSILRSDPDDDTSSIMDFREIFEDIDVKDELESGIEGIEFELNTADKLDLSGDYELWISGSSIIIELNVWKEFYKNI